MSRRESTGRSDRTLKEIERLQAERDERRRLMEQARSERAAEAARNIADGNPGDVDFQKMIRLYREECLAGRELKHSVANSDVDGEGKDKETDERIIIAVRKRPVNAKEVKKHDYDSVTCVNPLVIVHDCKRRVDGITKYLDNTAFTMDHTFHESDSTEDIYQYCVESLVPFILSGGRGTVFAYGQTGSGKTYTMVGIQQMAIADLFAGLEKKSEDGSNGSALIPYVSFFEIYGGRCQDLLNNRNRLAVREDGAGDVVIAGLMEEDARSAQEMTQIIDLGNRNRTTHATESNDESSRSHAICQIVLRHEGTDPTSSSSIFAKLSLIDLAGSERGADTKSHNRQRRLEGAEINKSLLALKECIRALDTGSTHVPYRGSKLTLVLKDSFTRARARTVMIATVSPAASSADHTLNTLRYADRIKERTVTPSMLEPLPTQVSSSDIAKPPPPPSSSDRTSSNLGDKRNGRRKTVGVGGPRKAAHSPVRTSSSSIVDRKQKRDTRKSLDSSDRSGRNSNQLYAGAGGGGGTELRSSRDSTRASTERERALAEHKSQTAAMGSLGDIRAKKGTQHVASNGESPEKAIVDHQKTVEVLFEEEEQLLNMHMAIIQVRRFSFPSIVLISFECLGMPDMSQ
jgi:kinesin family member 2/24